jgi:hypothetical protein
MDDHSRVLQQRVEIAAIRRQRNHPLEGIRGEQEEQQKADADEPHDRYHARQQRQGQIAGEHRYREAPAAEHQCPQEQRAFVRSPRRGDAILQGQLRIGIGGDVLHGKIIADERPRKTYECHRDQQRLGPRRWPRQRHQARCADRRAEQRQRPLHQRDQQREDHREVPEFRNHRAPLAGSWRLFMVIPFCAASMAALAWGGM